MQHSNAEWDPELDWQVCHWHKETVYCQAVCFVLLTDDGHFSHSIMLFGMHANSIYLSWIGAIESVNQLKTLKRFINTATTWRTTGNWKKGNADVPFTFLEVYRLNRGGAFLSWHLFFQRKPYTTGVVTQKEIDGSMAVNQKKKKKSNYSSLLLHLKKKKI